MPLALSDHSEPDDFEPKIEIKQTESEWRRIMRETRRACKTYEESYGIKVLWVKRFHDSFIWMSVKVVDQKKFSKYGDDVEQEFCSFLNHDLENGGYPSFYKGNWENQKYVDRFVCIRHIY